MLARRALLKGLCSVVALSSGAAVTAKNALATASDTKQETEKPTADSMLSIFDLFKIGIGPSSSHTVGPMVAGKAFSDLLVKKNLVDSTKRVLIELYGSLALTGDGHGTVAAILNGLEGETPQTVEHSHFVSRLQKLRENDDLQLAGRGRVPFVFTRDMLLHKGLFLPRHPNALTMTAYGGNGQVLFRQTYYSIGGGFIRTEENFDMADEAYPDPPYVYHTATELFNLCAREKKTVAEIVLTNETCWRSEAEVDERIRAIAQAMFDAVERGCYMDGILPGGLGVRRRAPQLLRKLTSLIARGHRDTSLWPMLYALAVSEENANGGRMVTAPTMGAAGVVPGVLMYYKNFHTDATDDGIRDFLLTAGAIGLFYKQNASISGAEVGCQGEVGVACSMAAGAYCAVLGGNVKQVEVAAEIGMEHNLGLTCDPVGGLVQIPCIERNGVAAERAIDCAQLSLLEDARERIVPLDKVIDVMYRTGLDLQSTYKETSLGGLAKVMGEALNPQSDI